jgi:hypothetical protein
MTQDSNERYAARYLEQAESTDSEAIRKDCLYRVGTSLEIIPSNGDADLSAEEQQRISLIAKDFLGGEE